MAIKFNCPHCNKPFTVKDDMAGKRRGCPACKKMLTVPAPTARPADLEEFAAAALAEQPVSAAPEKEPDEVEFVCSYCDTRVKVAADLVGKQTSCPECRRIVKVPFPEKQGAKDWRKVDARVPAGARRDLEPALEGAWDARAVGAVSREALLEADAVPQVKPKRTWKQWARIAGTAGAFLVVVTLIVIFWLNYRAQTLQQRILARALEGIEENKDSLAVAELYRAAGEYNLIARIPDAETAKTYFQKSRTAASKPANDAHSNERECLLTDLLLSQADLGGEKQEEQEGKKIAWDKIQVELTRTWKNLRIPEGRAEALRSIMRRLAAKDEAKRSRPWASEISGAPELVSIYGLEMLRAGKDRVEALQVSDQVSPPSAPEPAPKPGQETKKPPPPSSLLALLLALDKRDRVQALIGPLANGKAIDSAVAIGMAEGWARKGSWTQTNEVVAQIPQAERLPALVAVCAVALDSEPAEPDKADVYLEQAFSVAAGHSKLHEVSPWLLYRLVGLGAKAGMEEKALSLAKLTPDPDLRGRAQLAVLRARLAKSQAVVDESLLQFVDKNTHAHKLALQAWARHNARFGGARVQKSVDAWSSEADRRFGYMGMVLGLQDAAR